ncbi:MAG: hypothetical protein HY741_29270 [Chloroflexi bacterium]|nr:hypothetical protein [Chloroflexota bacterium]
MDTGLVIPIVSWYLVLGALALVGLPIALFLFKHLPDCGYAFSRALGLLFIGYIAWLLTILGFARFNYNLLLFLVFCIGALGWFIVLSQPRDLARLRTRWRNILGYEALFLIAFLFIVWLRSYDPHPQGTERPMDYALYNAVMQSQTFPPHDPWLSGYAINYYYFGYLLMSVPTLLSRSDPAIGYNLSLATLFALTAVHVAALINTLIALNREKQNTSSRRTLLDAVLPLLGIFLVLIVGNQAGALQVLTGTEKVVAFDAQQTWAAILNRLEGAKDTLYLPYPTPLTSDFGTLQDVKLGDAWSDFNWCGLRVRCGMTSQSVGNYTGFTILLNFLFLVSILEICILMCSHCLSLYWSLLQLLA